MLIRQGNKSPLNKTFNPTMKKVIRIRLTDIAKINNNVSLMEEFNDEISQEQDEIKGNENDFNQDTRRESNLKTCSIGHSFLNTMTNEELNSHIQKCLEMSSENKITPKNAFALQLIDCMYFLLNKKDFSTMACTLDAGTKIYSSRVDALHQQVLKLADEVIINQSSCKQKETNGNTEAHITKDKRKANKRHIIASTDSLRIKLKGKDPRDKYIKVEGLPGEMFKACRINTVDLSTTLENNIQFWTNFDHIKPLKADGVVTLPEYKLYRNNNAEMQKINTHDYNNSEAIVRSEVQSQSSIMDSPMLHNECDSIKSDSDIENVCEVSVISTAMQKLNEEAEQEGTVGKPPSRFEAMKLIFQRSSDYHYLDMKNSHFWAGPEFWKRPRVVAKGIDKKITTRKKGPPEITYGSAMPKEENKRFSKKCTVLNKRTIAGWKRKRLTLPKDLKCDVKLFRDLFVITVHNNNHVNLNSSGFEIDKEIIHNVVSEDISNPRESQNSLDEAFYEGVFEDQMDTRSELGDTLNSAFYDGGLIQRSGKVVKIEIDLTEGSNLGEHSLVPAPKIVRFEPIKYLSRPVRVDMQHLKNTMLDVIQKEINGHSPVKQIRGENSARETTFGNVLKKLPAQLQPRTAEDLSPAMALMALLTLANENNLHLQNDETDNVVIQLEDFTLKR